MVQIVLGKITGGLQSELLSLPSNGTKNSHRTKILNGQTCSTCTKSYQVCQD